MALGSCLDIWDGYGRGTLLGAPVPLWTRGDFQQRWQLQLHPILEFRSVTTSTQVAMATPALGSCGGGPGGSGGGSDVMCIPYCILLCLNRSAIGGSAYSTCDYYGLTPLQCGCDVF